MKEADTIRLGQAERQQLQDGGAPGHRLADALHQGSLLGAGEQPLAHYAGILIDARADVAEQFRHVLDLVEHRGEPEFFEQGPRIGTRAGLYVGIFQEHIGGAREEPSQQGRLSGPTRPRSPPRRGSCGRHPAPQAGWRGDEAHVRIKLPVYIYRPQPQKTELYAAARQTRRAAATLDRETGPSTIATNLLEYGQFSSGRTVPDWEPCFSLSRIVSTHSATGREKLITPSHDPRSDCFSTT